jgi:hypothetical protein
MNKLLVGSQAAKHWFKDFRQPQDIDYWVNSPDTGNYFDVVGETRAEYKDVSSYLALSAFLDSRESEIATPEELYTIKVSHSFWAKSFWEKTIKDILFFQEKGVQVDHYWLRMLYKDWELVHGKKQAYLNVKNEEFFTNTVDRKYEHDSIHKAIAYYSEPLYTRIKKDQSKAMCSEELFNKLSYEDRLKLCREEIYATALERWIIPSGFTVDSLTAYRKAIKQLVCSMSRGFFPEFIVLNLSVLKSPDVDFVEKLRSNECQLISLSK